MHFCSFDVAVLLSNVMVSLGHPRASPSSVCGFRLDELGEDTRVPCAYSKGDRHCHLGVEVCGSRRDELGEDTRVPYAYSKGDRH